MRRARAAQGRPIHPDEILLVADGMTGQDAVRDRAGLRPAASGVTGVILTKHRRRCARRRGAVDLRRDEEADQVHRRRREGRTRSRSSIPTAWPAAFSSMGDIVSLVEKAQTRVRRRRSRRSSRRRSAKEGHGPRTTCSSPCARCRSSGPIEGILKSAGRQLEDAQAGEPRPEADEARQGHRAVDDTRGRRNPTIINGLAGITHRQGFRPADQRGQPAAFERIQGHAKMMEFR